MAKGIRDIARAKNLQTGEDTQRIIRDTLGFDDVKTAKTQASKQYADLMDNVGAKRAGGVVDSDYKMTHSIDLDDNVSLDRLDELMPADIYSDDAARLYGTGMGRDMDVKSARIIKSLEKNPEQTIEVYRAVPKGVKKINNGDWVSINKDYANQHGISNLNGEYDIISTKAKAKDIFSNADSMHEQAIRIADDVADVDLYNNETLAQALKTARKQDLTGELAEYGDDTLAVAQRTKEALDDMIAGSKVAGDYGKQQNTQMTRQLTKIKNDFVNKLDEAIPEYKQVRKEFGSAKKANDLLDAIEELKGNLGANEANKLLTGKNKKALVDVYGAEKANKFIKELDIRSIKNDRIRKLAGAGEAQITKADTLLGKGGLRREKFESVGSLAGSQLDKKISMRERDLRKMVGSELMSVPQYTDGLDPFVKAIMGQQASRYNPFKGE